MIRALAQLVAEVFVVAAFVAAALPAQADPAATAAKQPAPSFAFLAEPPAGLPPMPKPEGYEPTAAMFALGERLFHDVLLSVDRTVSCATCHPSPGFASAEPLPAGIMGRRATRHAPALWNRGYSTLQRWDGRSPTLEAFVLEPIEDQNEMGLPLASALDRLSADARYQKDFQAAFGGAPDQVAVQRSLATFVRGIVRGNAPYDRFLRGEIPAMTQQQRTGLWLFESKGGCWKCHTPPLFTDERFHNTGIGVRDGIAEAGRSGVTGLAADIGAWKTPTLRGLALSAPYMHDGSLATLADVVAFYARGGNQNPHLDARLLPFTLTEGEQASLIAFLSAL